MGVTQCVLAPGDANPIDASGGKSTDANYCMESKHASPNRLREVVSRVTFH